MYEKKQRNLLQFLLVIFGAFCHFGAQFSGESNYRLVPCIFPIRAKQLNGN